MMNAQHVLTEAPVPGAIVMFDFGAYHGCWGGMTKVRPAIVLGVRGDRVLLIPLSTTPPRNAAEPCMEITFRLREHVRSYAKIMMLESVPIMGLRKPFIHTAGAYVVPVISELELEALRNMVKTIAFPPPTAA